MKKKVVWIVNEYNFPNAFKSRQTNLCRQLILRGYDAYIVSGSVENKSGRNILLKKEKFRFVETDEAKGYLINTSSYRRNFERVLVALQFQRRLWNLRNELPMPDVIVSDFAGLFGNIFLKWKKKYGTKVIYDILDLWPEGFVDMGYLKKNSLITKVLYNMEHKSYREADGIIFSFQGGRDYIIDKGWSKETGGDVDTSDIGYLNNGIDLESVYEQNDKWILDDPDLDSDKFKVVYLGSISAFNGLDVLVETARELHERKVQDVLFLVYGCGNQEEQLKNMAKDYNLKNIKFKGPVDKKYAMNLLSRSDLNLFTFVNTPLLKYGVSPNKLFMYFASGKPVLSMIKPKYDLVQEKKCGISVENDSKIVADAIMQFRRMDNEQYQMYCENARKTAIEYDYKNLVNCLIEKIEK
ncbi:glycosyltransferase family 4 protein [Erysipelatoclostridium ramosum]|uniref:glycosyltransferase family 4 protein n=1 Tax=Thomasclavelia ramosa TaxID=1547 RepID=UPI00192CB26D|nr:glycosyltransferase family 4 protein [Thomasclavelia ramosa]MCR1948256.1 glycosyltransferase family 4 protein [Thomasclavelia ramosa]QQY28478.1 glycosyltransferase family 4 protein [Thomasclavelia ramosa]